jgi:hypothetical protein
MGKRKILFAGVIVSAFAMLLANSFPAEAAGNCQGKLVGKFYTCTNAQEGFATGTICAAFVTGGISENFDMMFGSADYGCTCYATGTAKKPAYDSSSSSFSCIEESTDFDFFGKISGKKLTMQGADSDGGDSYIDNCTETSTPCQ